VSPLGPHAGDLPNIEVPSTKQLSVEYFMPEVTIELGRNSLRDADGAALVIHAPATIYASEPAGESGARLACGEFVASNTR
jgi:Cu-Zn family superoxide dismutase